MVGLGALIYAFMWFWYRRENRRRDEGRWERDDRYRNVPDDELKELGDDSPHYRYTI